jgi:hypothetical protein
MVRASLALAAVVVGGWQAAAQEQNKVIGNWIVRIESDPFNDGQAKVVAMTRGNGASVLAVRCMGGELSVALGGDKYDAGDLFQIKFRADKLATIDTAAAAISSVVLQLETPPAMLRHMLGAKQYAFRITGATATVDYIFKAGPRSGEALAEVLKACPLKSD